MNDPVSAVNTLVSPLKGVITGASKTHLPPIVPDHELIRPIGRGGYGEVWLARNIMGTYRAVKIVCRDSFKDAQPFEREYNGIQKFEPVSRSHAGMINILQIGRNEREGFFYYVMELADDEQTGPNIHPDQYHPKTIRSEIEQRGRLAFDECLQLGLALTAALGHLHKHGLVHRDLKPSNIIFVNGVPKLADIGLVAAARDAKSYVGTEGFIPPEGPGTPQADLYSLGKVLYEIVTGKDRQNFPEPPTLLEEFADRERFLEFNEVIIKACENDRCKRYLSAEQMYSELVLLQAGKSVKHLRLVERRLRFSTRIGGVTVLSALLAVGLYYGAIRQARRAEQSESTTRRNLYAADMYLVQHALDEGNFGLAKRALEAHRPTFGQEDLRGFEWRYFWKCCQGDKAGVLMGHSNLVSCLAVSPDCKWLASGSLDETVKLWDLSKRTLVNSLPVHGRVYSVAVSDDGRLLAVGREDGPVQLWDVATCRIAQTDSARSRWAKVAFCPGRKFLAIGTSNSSFGGEETVRLWDFELDRVIWVIPRCGRSVAFSPDGREIAAGGGEGIDLLNTSTGEVISRLGRAGDGMSLAFSPDSRALASTRDWDPSVLLWNTQTGELLGTLKGHSLVAWCVAFSPDGKTLATGSSDQTVRLWDVTTARTIRVLRGHLSEVWSAVFSPDSRSLFTGGKDESVVIWSVATHLARDELEGVRGQPFSPVLSPDGRKLAASNADRQVQVWDLTTARAETVIEGESFALAWSPNGESLVTLGTNGSLSVVELATLSVRARRELATGRRPIRNCAPRSNPHLLLTCGVDGMIEFWDTSSLELTSELQQDRPVDENVSTIELSPDGSLLAISRDRHVEIWDVPQRKRKTVIAAFKQGVRDIEFSPDGATLATCGGDGVIKLWDAHTFTEKSTLVGHKSGIDKLAFSPDGRTLLSASGSGTKLWNLGTGRELATFGAIDDGFWHVDFTPDGNTLILGNVAHSLHLFRAPTLRETDASPRVQERVVNRWGL